MLSIIVAASRNGVIGANNKLPWHLPADLKRFKQLTMGHPILMGRRTYESIGKPLPGRTNIVITRQKDFQCCGTTVAHSLEEALQMCDRGATAQRSKEMVALPLSADHENEKEAFVIGGAEIFKQALPFADRIYLTRINQDFKGDTVLFEIDPAVWKETFREEFPADPLPHTFITLNRG